MALTPDDMVWVESLAPTTKGRIEVLTDLIAHRVKDGMTVEDVATCKEAIALLQQGSVPERPAPKATYHKCEGGCGSIIRVTVPKCLDCIWDEDEARLEDVETLEKGSGEWMTRWLSTHTHERV